MGEALSHGYATVQDALSRRDLLSELSYQSEVIRSEREDNRTLREELKTERRRNHMYEMILQNEGFVISDDGIQKLSFEEDDEYDDEGTEDTDEAELV